MPKPKRFVLVDDRQVDWYAPALKAVDIDIKVRRLAVGDLAWTCPLGRVGVEDKPTTALMGDRVNGRLDDELRRLVEAYAIPILMVRGSPRYDASGGVIVFGTEVYDRWNHSSIDNLLLGRQLHGVYVTSVPYDNLVGERIASLYDYTQIVAPLEGVRRERQYAYLGPLSEAAECVYLILGFVGNLRNRRGVAEHLAGVCGGLAGVLALDEEQLRRRFGFSKLMASRTAAKFQELSNA